jgi:hypothetical protein
MTDQDKEFKIGAITLSFREYIYGFKRLKRVAGSKKSSKNKVLFYSHACNNYLASYFLIEDSIVTKTLNEVGLKELLEPINELLSTPVGEITYRETIRRLRNKAVVHEGYSSSNIDKIFSDAEMYSLSGNLQLAQANLEMFEEMKKLQRKLLSILPKNAGY